MASDKLPFFKWYPADAETDELFRSMSDAEVGFYMRCLNTSWLNGGIPADPTARARALNKPKKYCDERWSVVGECFELDKDDPSRYVNPRQERERAEALTKRVRNAHRVRTARERVAPIRASSSDSDAVDGSEKEKEIPYPEEPAKPELEDLQALAAYADGGDGFETYIGRFLATGKALNDRDMEKTLRIWLSETLEYRRAADNHAAAMMSSWDGSGFTPFPQNHLQDHPWTRKSIPRVLPPVRKRTTGDEVSSRASAAFTQEYLAGEQ